MVTTGRSRKAGSKAMTFLWRYGTALGHYPPWSLIHGPRPCDDVWLRAMSSR